MTEICAHCPSELDSDEVYICETCFEDFYEFDENGRMFDESEKESAGNGVFSENARNL